MALVNKDGVTKVGMNNVITQYYMEYAKSVIIDRAFPFIDGFKPVNRRIIYDMHELKAEGTNNKKSARIVGDTMGKYHPHGDSSIYGALVNMTDTHETLNAPLIKGQGSFGKSWSTEHLVPAAMRYTEARLTNLARDEMFNGLKEDAVDMIDNFSVDEKEPRLLPVSFPNLIINNTNGVAVGMSTYIPTYTLQAACEAVKSLIENPDIDDEELVDVLGAPDFCTGGNIHITRAQMKRLVTDGCAKGIYLTGTYSINKNQITIYELPYNTNVEKFVGEVKELYKNGILRGVKSIDNTSGRDTKKSKKKGDNSKCSLKVEIELTRNADAEGIMKIIRQNTSFSSAIAFYTKFVWWNKDINDCEYKECGIRSLLDDYWIPWRVDTIRRQYTFRYNKALADIHLLEAWPILLKYLDEYIAFAKSHSKADTKSFLLNKLKLDAEQADYIFGRRLSNLTVDEAGKMLSDMEDLKKKAEELHKIIISDTEIKKLIIEDMNRVISKYATERRCNVFGMELIEADKEEKKAPEVIENMPVWIGITKGGALKRALRETDSFKFNELSNGTLLDTVECMNKDKLLVFTESGYCYKVPIHNIETSKGAFRDSIWKIVDKAEDDNGKIIHVKATSDYKGTFVLIYDNGTGIVVPYNVVGGNRSRYKSVYPALELNKTARFQWEDNFYIVTVDDCAAFKSLTAMRKLAELKGKINFKLPRWKSTDSLRGFINESSIVLADMIDKERFERDYCVKMKNDKNYLFNIITERSADKLIDDIVNKQEAEDSTESTETASTSDEGYDF